jgi:hypothetical protein
MKRDLASMIAAGLNTGNPMTTDRAILTTIKPGETYSLPTGDLILAVRVLQLRSAYGREDAQITPISGSGTTWVAAYRLREV